MHIGLVGGIGPAATDHYYQRLIKEAAARDVPLELTMVHADSRTLLKNLAADDKAAQVGIFARLTGRLKAAGAGAVAITSIAGHFCIAEFEAVSPLPVVDLLRETDAVIARLGVGRVGILGTQTVMESRFYGGISSAEVIPPAGAELAAVHQAYIAMALAGKVTPEQRALFHAAGRRLVDEQGCEAVMLGGTDLVLAFDDNDHGFATIDCAGIHIAALMDLVAAP